VSERRASLQGQLVHTRSIAMELTRAVFVGRDRVGKEKVVIVFKAGILWLLGVPVVVIILLALFTNLL
jgi:hypothetical protein